MKEFLLNGKFDFLGKKGKQQLSFSSTHTESIINALINAGYLPKNILEGKNADKVNEFENFDWSIKTTFNVDNLDAITFLAFDRIDTYSKIYINNKRIATTMDGNISYKFNISKFIKEKDNILEIKLTSPMNHTKNMPKREGAYTTDRINTRRMQCTYGWDWLSRFLTCGFTCPKLLNYGKDETTINSMYVYTKTINNDTANVVVHIDDINKNTLLNFKIFDEKNKLVTSKSKFISQENDKLTFCIKNPKLWYPAGYGEQPLYKIQIYEKKQLLIEDLFGIKTIEIFEIPDEIDSENHNKCLSIANDYNKNVEFSSFTILLNGIKIFCKGANWVPAEPFAKENYKEKVNEILLLCKEMGLNVLRIWGGGAFEIKEFYRQCSRLGIMVIQDFLMACGVYPEKEKWFIDLLKLETEYCTKLIRNEPCLIWYHGDNENAVDGCDLDDNYTGKKSFYQGIYPIALKNDYNHIFLPSSPYGGNKYACNTVGTTHNTQTMGVLFDYSDNDSLEDYKEFYKKFRARFISEEPQFGAVSYSSLTRFMSENEIFGDNEDMWNFHTKTTPYTKKSLYEYMKIFAEKILGNYTDGKDRLFKNEYIQYEWIRLTMEQARREFPFCSGIIYWMLNDCWTAASGWALIDYYVKPKLAYYAFKNYSKPVICTIDKENNNNRFILSVSNNANQDLQLNIRLFDCSHTSNKVIKTYSIKANKNENTVIDSFEYDLKQNILVADLESDLCTHRCFYKSGTLKVERNENIFENTVDYKTKTITIIAKENIHCINIGGDYIFDDNGFIMLKDEKKTVAFKPTSQSLTKNITFDAYAIKK